MEKKINNYEEQIYRQEEEIRNLHEKLDKRDKLVMWYQKWSIESKTELKRLNNYEKTETQLMGLNGEGWIQKTIIGLRMSL